MGAVLLLSHVARGQLPSQRLVPRLAAPKKGPLSTGGLDISYQSTWKKQSCLNAALLACDYSAPVSLLHVFTCRGAALRVHLIGPRDECST
jgi:hypothetical protein